jgi:AMP nucleosidase
MNRQDKTATDTSLAGNFGRDFMAFDDAKAAVKRITEIYDRSVETIRSAFDTAAQGGEAQRVDATYPCVVTSIRRSDLHVDARLSWGVLLEAGTYGTTLTRPDLFARYY